MIATTSPLSIVPILVALTSAADRIDSPSSRTRPKPPILSPEPDEAEVDVTFQTLRLPFGSRARTRNAYACPSTPYHGAEVAVVAESQAVQALSSVETWMS